MPSPRSFNTLAVDFARKVFDDRIPRMIQTNAQLKSWMMSQIRSNNREIIQVLSSPLTMQQLEREMFKAGAYNEWRTVFKEVSKSAQESLVRPSWTQQRTSPMTLSSSLLESGASSGLEARNRLMASFTRRIRAGDPLAMRLVKSSTFQASMKALFARNGWAVGEVPAFVNSLQIQVGMKETGATPHLGLTVMNPSKELTFSEKVRGNELMLAMKNDQKLMDWVRRTPGVSTSLKRELEQSQKFLTAAKSRNWDGVKMPYGKYAGKSLQWLYDHRPDYLAHLDANFKHWKGDSTFRTNLAAFMETTFVRAHLRDYWEDHGGSSPADMERDRDRMGSLKTSKGRNIWGYVPEGRGPKRFTRDWGAYRQGGFAVHDSWGTARSYFDPYVTGARFDHGGYGGLAHTFDFHKGYKFRRGEQRRVKEQGSFGFYRDSFGNYRMDEDWFGREYYESLQKRDFWNVVRGHYTSKGYKHEQIMDAIRELEPWKNLYGPKSFRFSEVADRFFREESVQEVSLGLSREKFEGIADAGQRQKYGGSFDPWQQRTTMGAEEEEMANSVGRLGISQAMKLQTREGLQAWWQELDKEIGHDLVRAHQDMFNFDIDEFYRNRMNVLLANKS